jgi:hypothetical protein
LTLLRQEIEGRERAETNLLTFASAIEIPGAPVRPDDEACEEFRIVEAAFGKHQLLWLDCLQRVQDGEIKRLLGLMPPGSAKSTYTSIVFPVHTMGRELRRGFAAQVGAQGARDCPAGELPPRL